MLMPSVFGRDMFEDFFDFPFYDDKDMKKLEKQLYGRRGKNLMKTDVREKSDSYELTMDLPGFKKEEVNAQLKDGYLTISAAKGLDKDEQESGRYIRRERYAGCEFSYKSRIMGTIEPLKTLKAPYMARNPMKWGFFRLKEQEISLKI